MMTRPLGLNEQWAQPGHGEQDRGALSRVWGTDDTLNPDPEGMGTGENGYLGRDITQDRYDADPGMFRRLHEGGGIG